MLHQLRPPGAHKPKIFFKTTNKPNRLSTLIMALLGIPRLRNGVWFQCKVSRWRKLATQTKTPVEKYSLVFLVLEGWLLMPFAFSQGVVMFSGKLHMVLQLPPHPDKIWGNYILLLLLFFWLNKLQTTPLFPGRKKSDSTRWRPIQDCICSLTLPPSWW